MEKIKKVKREHIPDTIKLKIWSASGGRCEFRGCNNPLWKNELTLNDTNFAELAHIIAASENGPRGTHESKAKQIDADNIMLLCPKCHKEVDDPSHVEEYPESVLKEMKEDHEERIKIVTEILPESKTEILRFMCNIGGRNVGIDYNEVRSVILQNKFYPYGKGILIDRTEDDGDGGIGYWDYNASEIRRKIREHLKVRGNRNQTIEHLSVFALAPIPFLFVLGKELSDTHINKVELYQRHRDTQSWKWPNTDGDLPQYIVKKPQSETTKPKVALILSLSDFISEDKTDSIIDSNFDVYEITIDGTPNPNFLRHPAQIFLFEKEFRNILNEIQAKYGKDTTIHLFPAIPAPIAVKCGMCLLPKKDNPIIIYDFNKIHGGFRPVLTLDQTFPNT